MILCKIVIYIYKLINKYQLLTSVIFIFIYLSLGKIFDKYDLSQSFQSNVQSLERIIDPKSSNNSSSSSSSSSSIKSILRPSSPSSREDGTQPTELILSPVKVVPGRKNVMFNDDGDMIIKTPNEKTPEEFSPYDRWVGETN